MEFKNEGNFYFVMGGLAQYSAVVAAGARSIFSHERLREPALEDRRRSDGVQKSTEESGNIQILKNKIDFFFINFLPEGKFRKKFNFFN